MRVAGPSFFFDDVAIFQMEPSGAWTTPPYPQRDFLTGFKAVAPAASAAPTKASTMLGRETTSERVYPRNPVVGSFDSCSWIRSPTPRAVVEGFGCREVGNVEDHGLRGGHLGAPC